MIAPTTIGGFEVKAWIQTASKSGFVVVRRGDADYVCAFYTDGLNEWAAGHYFDNYDRALLDLFKRAGEERDAWRATNPLTAGYV